MDISAPSSISDAMVTLGRRLQSGRLLKEMTQAQLAAEVGVSERVIKKLEAGLNVGLETWLAVARRLDYLGDILSVLGQDKPTTIEQHQALGDGNFKRKRRIR